jgi:hypothetical protein
MKISRAVLIPAALGTLLAAGGCFSRAKTSAQADVAGASLDRRELAAATVSHWSNRSALAARRLMEEYGVPDEVHADRLVWLNNSPWKRTVVMNMQPAYVESGETGVIEQTVGYALTPIRAVAVASIDDRLAVNQRGGLISSRADTEAHNFLLLNLADDVAHERLQPQQARDSYASIVSFEAAGKTSPYLLGLRFGAGPAAEVPVAP